VYNVKVCIVVVKIFNGGYLIDVYLIVFILNLNFANGELFHQNVVKTTFIHNKTNSITSQAGYIAQKQTINIAKISCTAKENISSVERQKVRFIYNRPESGISGIGDVA
jgi:hypothetical protein